MKPDFADEEQIFAVVANIVRVRPCGHGGEEQRSGTRLFSGGAKVFIVSCYPGTCDAVTCIGRHRKSGRFITCDVRVTNVENFRVKQVYHPYVLSLIRKSGGLTVGDKMNSETWATQFLQWQEIWCKS